MKSESMDSVLSKVNDLMNEIYERANQNMPQGQGNSASEDSVATPTRKRKRLVWAHQKNKLQAAELDEDADYPEEEEGSSE